MKLQPRYKTVIFDLDGTLLDTVADLGDAVNHALSLHGYPLHNYDEYRTFVGHGIRDLMTRSLPEALRQDESLVDECLADFRTWYTTHIDVHTRPYPGIPALLEELQAHGVRLAVASNKFQAGTEQLIAEFFPDIRFVALLGNREGYPLKPDPEIVGRVLSLAGTTRQETVMVGDSRTDLQTAANGGIDGIAVSWGYRPLHGLPGIRLADTPAELRSLLLTYEKRP